MTPDSPAHLALVGELVRAWDLEASDVILASQSENLVYRVDTTQGERVAVRLHRPGYHTRAELESEQQWTSALNAFGINVPVGRPLATGDYYTDAVLPDGEQRQVGVVDWLPGRPLFEAWSDIDDRTVVARHFRSAGQLTARMHAQAAAWTPPAGFSRHHLDADGFMGDAPFWGPFWDLPELTPEERDLVLSARKQLYDLLSSLDRSSSQYSMIHADLHASNLMVNGEQLIVIDFDDAGFGFHIYDMAVTFFSLYEHPDFALLRDAYVEGYRSERTLTDETLALLPAFLLVRGLASLGWVHHRRELGRSDRIRPLIERICREARTIF